MGDVKTSNSEGGFAPDSPRAVVADFQAAVEHERRKLEAMIVDARARQQRARAAIGMHRTMEAMILDAQREMADLRRDVETMKARILLEADPQGTTPSDADARRHEYTMPEEIKWT